MNKQDFIKKVKYDCKTHGVKFVAGRGKQINYAKGIKISGLFSDEPPLTLAYATKHKDCLETLVHESSHMDQWISQIDMWTKSKSYDDDQVFDDWLTNKREFTKNKIESTVRRIQEVELDCERRAVEKIKRYNLPIDVPTYIKKANSYLLLYTLMKENRKWSKTPPYRIKAIVDVMPDKFLKDYSKMSGKLKKLYEACYS
jgi:hypothetical protein